jgi:hypothetical protein
MPMIPPFPLAPSSAAIGAGVIFLAVFFRRVRLDRTQTVRFAVVLAVLAAAKIAIAAAAPDAGWLARYYANESWMGAPEWSSEFPRLNATRIDPQISFTDETFPAYYLNDARFESAGAQRAVEEAMSVEWTGYVWSDAAAVVPIRLTVRGAGIVRVDGNPVLEIAAGDDGPREADTRVSLSEGAHTVEVRYVKPRGVAAQIDFAAPFAVAPAALAAPQSMGAMLGKLKRGADAGLVILGASLIAVLARAAWPLTVSQAATFLLFAGFGVQGWRKAHAFAGKLVALNPGDDWFGYESYARDILAHGPLMTFGKPIGEGSAYFWHPLYTYFLAAVHAVTGESLFGPVFVQFLVLAAVAAMMWRFAEHYFGRLPAVIATCALVVVFELDFARYYTVTLLTENLYILTVTLTLIPFVRWVDVGSTGDLVRTAFWGGISSITRPAMMFYFVPALALIAFVSLSRTRRVRTALVSTAIAASVWMLAIAPVTARNWVMSHRFVLISDVSSRVFDLLQHMPPSVLSSAGALQSGAGADNLRLLASAAWEHPWPVLLFQLKKLGFAAGMTQWFGGYRPHPELIGVTLLYVAMCMAPTRLRERRFWPVHLFVLTHLAAMMITIPWNYGYRLIIPPFVYLTTLSVAALASLAEAGMHGRALRRGRLTDPSSGAGDSPLATC